MIKHILLINKKIIWTFEYFLWNIIKRKLKCKSLKYVLPSSRSLDILKIGVGNTIECVWERSISMFPILDTNLCIECILLQNHMKLSHSLIDLPFSFEACREQYCVATVSHTKKHSSAVAFFGSSMKSVMAQTFLISTISLVTWQILRWPFTIVCINMRRNSTIIVF